MKGVGMGVVSVGVEISLIVFNDDGEPENLFEEIALRLHGKALHRGIRQTGKSDVHLSLADLELDIVDSLGVRPLQGIGNSQ